MLSFYYVVTIEANSQDEADIVIGSRLGHDEDLRDEGVDSYTIDYTPAEASSHARRGLFEATG